MKKIIGIDPGLETTGFAIIELDKQKKPHILDCGVLLTDKKQAFEDRLLEIATETADLIKEYKPNLMAIEKLVFVKNVSSGILVSHARGVVLAEGARAGVQILELQPTEIKMRVTGYGRAPKIQVQTMVQKIFNLAQIPKPDDAADALAIAYSAIGDDEIMIA